MPTEPAGPARTPEYAYIYNELDRTIAVNASVPFDSNGLLTPGIIHATGAAGVQVVNAGDYKVTFSVSGTEPNQMALFLNGVVVEGTIYGSGAGTQQNTGQAIFTIGAGNTLTLRNHASTAEVGLATPIGGTEASANASLTIEKLN